MLQKEEITFSKKAYEKEIQKPGFEFNTELALIDLQTTGRWIRNLIIFRKFVWTSSILWDRDNFRKKFKLYCSYIWLHFGKQLLTIQKKQN